MKPRLFAPQPSRSSFGKSAKIGFTKSSRGKAQELRNNTCAKEYFRKEVEIIEHEWIFSAKDHYFSLTIKALAKYIEERKIIFLEGKGSRERFEVFRIHIRPGRNHLPQ